MIANLLIGLREGLEATIVVSILIAFLVKTGRRDRLRPLWAGVAAAVLLALGVGGGLTLASKVLTFEAQELLGGILSVVAVVFVTWMVFWMKGAARHLRSDLDARMRTGVELGATAVAVTAFLAVGREGMETAFFLYAAVQATGQTWQPLVGATAGLALAVALGWLLYRQAVRIDLRRFFTWTGAALVVVAGGVLAYGVHDLQEAGVLPGLHSLAFDVSEQVPPTSWYGVLLKGTLNFSPATTWLEAAAWVAYVVPVLALYLRPARPAAVVPAAGASSDPAAAPSRAAA
ncbi:iron uptake transporter permease EfeU [Quadrisphaera sp. DSM 44207]|uniref:iron uptake transporter permease EfeU n=1 Tax=Quadrisphaera sp. DSM 44207 TaxID=1881057 RepID=UPI0008889582|nr:iron uptake transporter permease EfeU [Quadrisphaera sp. DSM 44207]SDQ49581.1 high-affinity iron transporter [Quadrisphaera sp. DSM 44207]